MADDVQLNATAPTAPDVTTDKGTYGPAVPAATVTPESHPTQVQFPSGHVLAVPAGTPTSTVSAASEDFWDRVKDAVPVLKGDWIKHPMAPEDAGQLVYPERANTPTEQREHPVMTGVGEFAGGLTSPENILMMLGMGPLGETAPLASKLIAGGFSASMLHNAMQKSPEAWAAYKRGDLPEAQRLATHALLSTLMATGTAAGVAVDEGRPALAAPAPSDLFTEPAQESTPNATMSRDPNLAALEANRRGAAEEMARKYPVKPVGLRGAEQARVAPQPTTVGNAADAARDTDLFQQAREQLGPNATISEIAQKAQELKTQPVAVNASGESAASQEAINRLQSQAAQGVKTYRVDTRSGKAVPVLGVDAVDATAKPFEKIVQVKGGEVTEMDSGRGARPLDEAKLLQQVTPSTTSRIAQRAKAMAADESGEATVPFTGQQQVIPGMGRPEEATEAEAEDTRPNVPTFFSKVGKIVDEKMQGKAGAGNQILATLKNNGAKDDEIKWMGLDDFLKDKPKVSKAELQQYIKDNQIQVKDVNRSAATDQADLRAQQNQVHDYITGVQGRNADSSLGKAIQEWLDGEGPESTKKLLAHPDMTPELASEVSRYDQLEHAQETAPERRAKYSQYVLDGPKENYNEKLLTLPSKYVPDADAKSNFESLQEQRNEFLQKDEEVPAELEARFQKAQDFMRNGPQPRHEAEVALRAYQNEMIGKYGPNVSSTSGVHLSKLDSSESLKYEGLQTAARHEAAGNRSALQARNSYQSPHFEEPNILAHVRHDDRIDTDGKKNLFLEEVQSDWHQAGKREGYKSPVDTKELAMKVDVAEQAYEQATKQWKETADAGPERDAARQRVSEASNAMQQARDAYKAAGGNGVPDAPFKSDWHELAIKRMLREAAEKGYDRMSWTTGEQQQNRYDLSHEISRVEYDPDGGRLTAYDHDGNETIDERVDDDEESLAKYIGAGPAKKLAEQIRNYEPPSEDGFDYDWARDNAAQNYDIDERLSPDFEEPEIPQERHDFNNYQAELAKKYGADPNIVHPDMRKRPNGWQQMLNETSAKLTPEEREKGLALKRAADNAEAAQDEEREAATRYHVVSHGEDVGDEEGYDTQREAERAMEGHIQSDVDYEAENYEPEKTGDEELPSIDGLDLKVGGEWAQALYDRAIPNFLNKYLKKWGGKVGTAHIPVEQGEGLPYELVSPSGHLYDAFRTRQQAQDGLKSMEGASEGTGWTIRDKSPQDEKVHSIDITPAMRKAFLKEGQPIAKVTPPAGPAQPDNRKQRIMQNLTEALA